MGRITIIKMALLPKMTFLFLNAIIDISDKVLDGIQKIINKFIWANKKPQVAARTMELQLED